MKPSLKANRRLTIALTLSAAAVLGITGIASATSRVFEDSPAVTTPITQTTVGYESPVSTPSSVDPSAPSSSVYDDEAEDATSSSIDDAAPSSSIYDENEAEDEDEYATSSSIDGAAPSSSIDDDEDESDDDSATSSTIEDSATSSTIDDSATSSTIDDGVHQGGNRKGANK
jgi:hypothetical protein